MTKQEMPRRITHRKCAFGKNAWVDPFATTVPQLAKRETGKWQERRLGPGSGECYTGVGLSLLLALRKASSPTLVEYTFNASDQLTQLADGAARVHPRIAIIHVEGELFFGAADLFKTT